MAVIFFSTYWLLRKNIYFFKFKNIISFPVAIRLHTIVLFSIFDSRVEKGSRCHSTGRHSCHIARPHNSQLCGGVMVLLQGPPARPQQKIRHLHSHFISGTTFIFRNIVILYNYYNYTLYSWSLVNRRELTVAVNNVDAIYMLLI